MANKRRGKEVARSSTLGLIKTKEPLSRIYKKHKTGHRIEAIEGGPVVQETATLYDVPDDPLDPAVHRENVLYLMAGLPHPTKPGRKTAVDDALKIVKGEAEGKHPMIISTSGCRMLGKNSDIFADKTGGAFFQWVFSLYGDQEELIRSLTGTAGGEPVNPPIQVVTQPAQAEPQAAVQDKEKPEAERAAGQAIAMSADDYVPDFAKFTPAEQRIYWKFILNWIDIRFRAMDNMTFQKNTGVWTGLDNLRNQVRREEGGRNPGKGPWKARVDCINSFIHGGDIGADLAIAEAQNVLTHRHGATRRSFFGAAWNSVYKLKSYVAKFILDAAKQSGDYQERFQKYIKFLNKLVAARDHAYEELAARKRPFISAARRARERGQAVSPQDAQAIQNIEQQEAYLNTSMETLFEDWADSLEELYLECGREIENIYRPRSKVCLDNRVEKSRQRILGILHTDPAWMDSWNAKTVTYTKFPWPPASYLGVDD